MSGASHGIRRKKFQSTLPRGERHKLVFFPLPGDEVSIHAPARGATYRPGTKWRQKTLFQSTLPRGERPDTLFTGQQFYHCFNPRSREGSDTLSLFLVCFPLCFNPRSREGSDIFIMIYQISIISFNPRSREGSD